MSGVAFVPVSHQTDARKQSSSQLWGGGSCPARLLEEHTVKKPKKVRKTNPAKKPGASIISSKSEAKATTPPKIVEVASEIRKLLHGDNERTLSSNYEISEHVQRTQQGSEYGQKPLVDLAKELSDFGLSAKTLANYAAVSKNIDRERFDEYARRAGGSKEKPFKLTWSHFLFFATIDGRELRPLLTMTFEKSLTAKQAAKEWRVLNEGKPAKKAAKERNDVARSVRALTTSLQSLRTTAARIDETLTEVETKKTIPSVLGEDLKNLTAELKALEEFASKAHARCAAQLTRAGVGETENAPGPNDESDDQEAA
jgi:hypothetical protein